MEHGKFKLYNPKSYCETSELYNNVKSAILEAWEHVYETYNLSQKFRPREEIVTLDSKINDISYYVCGNNSSRKNIFEFHVLRRINMFVPLARFSNLPSNFVNNKITVYEFCKGYNEYLNGKS